MKKNVKPRSRDSLAMLASLLLLIIFLCIPYFNKIFIGVFGYAVYAYIAALSVALFFLHKGYRITLPKARIAIYSGFFAGLLLTLHVGFARDIAQGGFGSYIFDTFSTATVGGALASIVSSIIVIPAGYLISLLIFLFLTASLLLLALKPLLIKSGAPAAKQKFFERLNTPPAEQTAPLPVIELAPAEEQNPPLTAQDFVRPEIDARQTLFGNPNQPKTVPPMTYSADELRPKKEEKKENPYQILPNIDAPLIKPMDECYTNSYIRSKKAGSAKQVLLGTTLEEDYIRRYGEKPAPEKSASKYGMTPYRPDNAEAENMTPETAHTDDEPDAYGDRVIFDSCSQSGGAARIAPEKTVFSSAPEKPYTDTKERHTDSTNRYTDYQKPYSRAEKTHTLAQKPAEDAADSAKEPPLREAKSAPKPFIYPHAGLLKNHAAPDFVAALTQEQYDRHKDTLEKTLEDFGIAAEVFNAIKGPTVTRYELRLAQGGGNSVNKVLNLQKDLKMVLEADGEINILAPIRGRNAIGIEIPNKKRGIVSLRETILTPEFQGSKTGIKLALGKTLDGAPYIGDLEDMPHLLVAGATGTGKSVCINTIITSILFQHSPDEVKLLLIDPKKVELINYVGLPHLLVEEPLVDIPEIVTALKWIREETIQRYTKFRDLRVVNINAYNDYARRNDLDTIPKIVVIIDEASELMTKAKKEVEETLSSLARIGRAAGVHLIFATQSPTKDVITSEIQNNLNTKIAFAVSDYVHSQVIFKTNGAEKLLGKGDMFLKGSGGELTRIQCSYVSPEEIRDVVEFIAQNNEVFFDESIHDAIYKKEEVAVFESIGEPKAQKNDDSFVDNIKEALKIALVTKRISTSLLQRKMEKGYNSAAKIIDYLEEKGYISPPDNVNKKREVLITVAEFLEMFPEESDEMLGIK